MSQGIQFCWLRSSGKRCCPSGMREAGTKHSGVSGIAFGASNTASARRGRAVFRCSAHPAGPSELRFLVLGFWDPWYWWVGCLVVGWLVGWLLVGWLVVGGWLFVVGCWLVGWWLVVPLVGLLLVLGGWWARFGLPSCSQLLDTTLFWVRKLFRTTWYHLFGPKKEVFGSWWWHVVAWLVGWSLGGWVSGAKT